MIMYYTKTKGFFGLLDMKWANYTCSRRTNSWPANGCFDLQCKQCKCLWFVLEIRDNPLITKLEFVWQLGFPLIEPLRRRLQITNLRRDNRKLIQSILQGDGHPIGSAVSNQLFSSGWLFGDKENLQYMPIPPKKNWIQVYKGGCSVLPQTKLA